MGGMATDVADASMAERREVGHHRAHRAVLVHDHAHMPVLLLRRDAGVRDPEIFQAAQQGHVVGDRRGQDHPVQLRLHHQRLDLADDVVGVVDQRRQHQVVVLRLAGIQHAQLDFHQVVARRVVEQHRHQVRAPPGQHARRRQRPITQLFDRGLDQGAGARGHVGLVVEHARHRLHRDAGRLGHVLDAHAPGLRPRLLARGFVHRWFRVAHCLFPAPARRPQRKCRVLPRGAALPLCSKRSPVVPAIVRPC